MSKIIQQLTVQQNRERFYKECDTGDILLYERVYSWKSPKDWILNIMDFVIGKFTKSKYIHTAMIVKNPSWNSNLKGIYIIESNWENVPDAENHEIKCGVELIPIQTALSDVTEHIYWRRLHCERNETFLQAMNDTQSIVHNRPYDFIITDWLKAAFNIDIGNTHRKKTFWCSALVAYFYHQLDLLENENIPWSIISPMELGTEYPSKSLIFKNCTVDVEVQIS